MKIKNKAGATKSLPQVPYFVVTSAPERPGLLVPCFFMSEVAMVSWFLGFTHLPDEIRSLTYEKVLEEQPCAFLSAETVREAAEMVMKKRTVRVYIGLFSGAKKVHPLRGTARRILTPHRVQKTVELLREQIRKGI